MAEGYSPDYWQMICNGRDRILAAIKETDWVEAKNKDGIRVTYRETDQGRMYHVETELDIPPATARRYFTPGPNGLRDKFIKKNPLKEFRVVQEEDKYFIAYEVLHALMLGVISERDCVSVFGGEDVSDIGAYMVSVSINHPDYPPQGSSVRLIKHITGQVLLRVDGEPNKCVLHGVGVVDMGGMIPVSIIQSFQPKMFFERITELKQAIANKFHEKN